MKMEKKTSVGLARNHNQKKRKRIFQRTNLLSTILMAFHPEHTPDPTTIFFHCILNEEQTKKISLNTNQTVCYSFH